MRSFDILFVASILSMVKIIASDVDDVDDALFADVNRTICVRFFSHRESRYVPYTETYKARKWPGVFQRIETRVNYRTEYNTVLTVDRKCCPGYRNKNRTAIVEISVPKDCEPVCTDACINGICVLPNTCQCNPGFSKVNETFCVPECTDACVHGRCVSPNVCVCETGYVPSKNESSSVCEPFCEPACAENQTCGAPNNCTCDEGYAADSEGRCVSVCSPPCLNGTCVAPNECRCFDGFFVDHNNFECVPACARNCSGHGMCVREEEGCECRFGWTGTNCEEPSFCILRIDMDDPIIDGITVRNETNSVLEVTRINATRCYRCKDSVDNETLCYLVKSDDDDVQVAECFIKTDTPCFTTYEYQTAAIDVSKLAGTLAVVTILIMAGATTLIIFLYRRHQRKKKLRAAIVVQTTLSQGTVATESLLSEEVDFI